MRPGVRVKDYGAADQVLLYSTMDTHTIVFIATSLDGYIADKDGNLDWLHAVPNPDNIDMGFVGLMEEVDAVVMGRTTIETVVGFGVDWPYSKPVFVLSSTLDSIPEYLTKKVTLTAGSPRQVLSNINAMGYRKLYVDGGNTVQRFLHEDLIDELRITTVPILLGGGYSLFGELDSPLEFELLRTETFLGQLVQRRYRRKR